MRPIIFIFALALITSCRSHKDVQKNISVDVDSVARSKHHRTIAVLDTLAAKLDFDFDTLSVTIERPAADMPPEVIKVKAVKGKISHSKEQRKLAAAHEERLDTLAYKLSSADNSAEHTATTRVYDPPNTGVAIIVSLLIIGGLAYFIIRRKI